MFMVKWKHFCSCENTWEPKAHLPSEQIEAFENPEPDPVRVKEARERIGLVFERGMKVSTSTRRVDRDSPRRGPFPVPDPTS